VANSEEFDRLLSLARQGDPNAHSLLYAAVYDEMRRMAYRHMSKERAGHTLQPTALVHEVYIKLVRGKRNWAGRTHFLAVASQVMRRVLVDHARAVLSKKRGGIALPLELNQDYMYTEARSDEMVALGQALDKLDCLAPRQSRVIELHFFGGLDFDEIGDVLQVSARTAKRDWNAARTWLHGEMNGWRDHARRVGQG